MTTDLIKTLEGLAEMYPDREKPLDLSDLLLEIISALKDAERMREAILNYTEVRAMIHQLNPRTGKPHCDEHCFCRLKKSLTPTADTKESEA